MMENTAFIELEIESPELTTERAIAFYGMRLVSPVIAEELFGEKRSIIAKEISYEEANRLEIMSWQLSFLGVRCLCIVFFSYCVAKLANLKLNA